MTKLPYRSEDEYGHTAAEEMTSRVCLHQRHADYTSLQVSYSLLGCSPDTRDSFESYVILARNGRVRDGILAD